jgi:hypothetical protein
VKSADELRHVVRFPAVVKTSVGTASRGIWFMRNEADLEGALQELSAQHLSANGVFAVPTDVLTTAGNLTTWRSSSADFTMRVIGWGKSN